MNKGLTIGISFVAGVLIGGFATRQYFKTKYETIANEEIESVKAIFNKNLDKEQKSHLETIEQAQEMNKLYQASINKKEDQKQYRDVLDDVNYSGYVQEDEPEGNPGLDPTVPYLIDEDEFGVYEGYKQVYVTYYADEILVDDEEEIITDAEERFGYDCLKEFDKDDVCEIYVRNELLQTEYNIVCDYQCYTDIYSCPDIGAGNY